MSMSASRSNPAVGSVSESRLEAVIVVAAEIRARTRSFPILSSDPNNTLLLMNYGLFLHETLGDFCEAEKCYSRAILLSPRDGYLLSLYEKLLWDQGQGEKAGHYYDLAAKVAPDDCFVLGAQAYFLWSLDEDEEGVEEDGVSTGLVESLRL